jgi:hypothetical protein
VPLGMPTVCWKTWSPKTTKILLTGKPSIPFIVCFRAFIWDNFFPLAFFQQLIFYSHKYSWLFCLHKYSWWKVICRDVRRKYICTLKVYQQIVYYTCICQSCFPLEFIDISLWMWTMCAYEYFNGWWYSDRVKWKQHEMKKNNEQYSIS